MHTSVTSLLRSPPGPGRAGLPDDEMRGTFRSVGVELMFDHIKRSPA